MKSAIYKHISEKKQKASLKAKNNKNIFLDMIKNVLLTFKNINFCSEDISLI